MLGTGREDVGRSDRAREPGQAGTQPPDPEYVTLKAAAAYLMLHERTVRSMATRGQIRAYGIGPRGGSLRFKVADLRGYVESCRRGTAPLPSSASAPTPAAGRLDGKPPRFVKMPGTPARKV